MVCSMRSVSRELHAPLMSNDESLCAKCQIGVVRLTETTPRRTQAEICGCIGALKGELMERGGYSRKDDTMGLADV